MTIQTNKQWYALYVASRQEKNSTRLLREKGIEAYVPLIKTVRQWSDRKKIIEIPLLSGYVFVNIDASENNTVLNTKGVVNFVKSEGKIAVLKSIEIIRLKQLVELGYQLEANPINRNFERGEKVTITSGPLKNIEGNVIEHKEGKFIEVLLESIGQSLKVKLPEGIIKNI